MVVDVDMSAHGIWKQLKDLFHNNKDARVAQLDNEIRNLTIENSSVTDFFQDIKSKADRLANLDSPVKDTSLVTYAVNGIRSKYPDAARIISLSPSLLYNTSSSPTVLVASATPHDKANIMSTLGFDVCRNIQHGSFSYGSRCKFVHGANDLRPRSPNSSSTTQGRVQSNSMNCTPQPVLNIASKHTVPNTSSNFRQSCVA
ncbi:Toll/interleukin-1 receptor domain-containing protein [Tanacetum coccineum]